MPHPPPPTSARLDFETLRGAAPDAVLEHFTSWLRAQGLTPFAHQEQALLELATGRHVVLATPTGSGKSLVALGLHFAALCAGRRSFYTAPIKALVSEKFFALCEVFGAQQVGLLTGDASINASARIVCCTQEVLANMALRHAAACDAPFVVMDEFHYYDDAERGHAWQTPLLTLPATQFLLMSATLGNTAPIEEALHEFSGREVAHVYSDERPVPLDFAYLETPLHESVETLLAEKRAPVYVVSFTQREAAATAAALTSVPVSTRAMREELRRATGAFRFDSPYGKELKRILSHGIGLHHAGLLPRYRLLVEQLSQRGLLRVISGTDTLGVGVNIPIRTVLFTGLSKFDGVEQRLLSVREFQQIAGRAGRRGFDDKGSVACQAPAWRIRAAKRERQRTPGRDGDGGARGGGGRGWRGRDGSGGGGWRRGGRGDGGGDGWRGDGGARGGGARDGDGGRARSRGGERGREARGRARLRAARTPQSLQRRARPGDIEWNRATFKKLVGAQPEMLNSRFRLSHGLLLQLLQRETPQSGPRGGYGDLAQIIARCHERPPQKRQLLREAARLFRSLRAAGVVKTSTSRVRDEASRCDRPHGRRAERPPPSRVRVEIDSALQYDFSLHHTLSLFLVDLLSELDPAQPGYALRVLSCVEAVLENPGLLLRAQLRKLQRATMEKLKAQRVPHHERVARMRALRAPRPEAAFLDAGLQRFATRHPWMRREFLRPKSLAREMLEDGYGFNDYVRQSGVARHEGVLLRYLGQVQTTLEQTVPDALKNAELLAYEDRLRTLLQSADTSLQREWQNQVDLVKRAKAEAAGAQNATPTTSARGERANEKAREQNEISATGARGDGDGDARHQRGERVREEVKAAREQNETSATSACGDGDGSARAVAARHKREARAREDGRGV